MGDFNIINQENSPTLVQFNSRMKESIIFIRKCDCEALEKIGDLYLLN